MNRTLTRKGEAHYLAYRVLEMHGLAHREAYDLATAIVDDLTAAGLTVTKRSGGAEKVRSENVR